MTENATNHIITESDTIPALEPDGRDFDPEYPGSTEEHPYGFFPDGRPRKRRPHGKGGNAGQRSTGRMPSRSAEQAAALLASANDLFSLVFIAAGMPKSALTLKANNEMFESMARDALAADPKLCQKIMSMGVTGGRAGLAVAYGRLVVNMYPAMRDEYRENHPKELEETPHGD